MNKFAAFCLISWIYWLQIPLTYANDHYAKRIYVSTPNELYHAVQKANREKLGTHILLNNGHYQLNRRIQLSGSNIKLSSISNDPSTVVLSGKGMKKSNTAEVLIDVSGSFISLSGITLEQSANHLIQVRAEKNADYFSLSHCVLRDAYQQLLKVSSAPHSQDYADGGNISNCLFEYTAGIGPQYYIGGIDAHRSRNWSIHNNRFKNIASPNTQQAQHAIHFWRQSENIAVTNNSIENCDRGIGFGLGDDKKNHTSGGIIANNSISHSNPKHKFADAGIILEGSPNTQILNNVIQMNSAYPNAIEYRFRATQNVLIKGNITNKAITARDGAQAKLVDNTQSSSLENIKNQLEHFMQGF
ncbi:right-handed parallel beta-helix repeat-containing protein [Paraglaciecola aestuariivivens]